LPLFPEIADDTYATIGLTGPASTSGIAGAADPSLVEDTSEQISLNFMTDGTTSLSSTIAIGSAWYALDTAENGLPNSYMRVLILQVITAGSISGTINYQVFPLRVDEDAVYATSSFIVGNDVEGCMDPEACNYQASANTDDGSCDVND